MKKVQDHLRQLDTLLDLRERERERLEADMAERRATQQRFEANLARLTQLAQGATASPATPLPPALLLNGANYKQAVLQLADRHRQDLALHEAEMARAQAELKNAALAHLVMGRVRDRQQGAVNQRRADIEQKGQDELANQAWQRRRPAA